MGIGIVDLVDTINGPGIAPALLPQGFLNYDVAAMSDLALIWILDQGLLILISLPV